MGAAGPSLTLDNPFITPKPKRGSVSGGRFITAQSDDQGYHHVAMAESESQRLLQLCKSKCYQGNVQYLSGSPSYQC